MSSAKDKEQMPIVGYCGPFTPNYVSPKGWKAPDYLTDSCYQMIRESGINLISWAPINYDDNPEGVLRSLELAEKHDIALFIIDGGIKGNMTVKEMEERMEPYRKFRSFKGLNLCDEPSAQEYGPKSDRMLENYHELSRKVNSIQGVTGYINLLAFHPDWIGVNGNTDWKERPYFEQYVEECCRDCAVKVLSEDYYIFDAHTVETSKDYFTNLEVLREYSQKYNIPFWMYIQLGGQWNDGRKQVVTEKYFPKPEEVIWNVNTSLACGAKGIAYFPLIQPIHFAYAPEGEMDFRRNGLIRADGTRSDWFDCTRKANDQIQAVGSYLMEAQHKQIVVKGYYAQRNLPNAVSSYGALESISLGDETNLYGAIVGCFAHEGGQAFYVVNNDIAEAQDITLYFDREYSLTLMSAERSETEQADFCIICLQPSSAVLVLVDAIQ